MQRRAGDYLAGFLQKMKQEMVVEDKDAEAVIDLICEFAQTGETGDGRIFVYPVEDVVQVRTKERGVRSGLALNSQKRPIDTFFLFCFFGHHSSFLISAVIFIVIFIRKSNNNYS